MFKKTLITLFGICTGLSLFSQEPDKWGVAVKTFYYAPYPLDGLNYRSFSAKTLGLNYKIPVSENNAIRVCYEQSVNTPHDSIGMTQYRYTGFKQASADYLWRSSRPLFLGVSLNVISFSSTVFMKDSPSDPGSWTPIEDHNEFSPQFILGWRFAKHLSAEFHTSILYNSVQIQLSF